MRPLVPAHAQPVTEAQVRATMAGEGCTREEAERLLAEEAARCSYWINDLYQVSVRRQGEVVQLNIRRRDGKPIFRDWRHFQQIKNELVGPECEGVELYPAESRLVDTSNKYHIWCCADPTYRFPFGWQDRDVVAPVDGAPPGFRQRRQT